MHLPPSSQDPALHAHMVRRSHRYLWFGTPRRREDLAIRAHSPELACTAPPCVADLATLCAALIAHRVFLRMPRAREDLAIRPRLRQAPVRVKLMIQLVSQV